MNMPNKKDDSNLKNVPKPQKFKKSKKFYIALGICLAAVSAAAWSTYESVKDFITPPGYSSETRNTSKAPSKNFVSKSQNKNGVLEENSSRKNQKPIPYDSKKHCCENCEESERLCAASAEKTDLEIVYPCGNTVTKEFSDGKPVYSATMGDWRIHPGADFKAEKGSKVKAITGGVVKEIVKDPAYGTGVIIEHDSKFTAFYRGLGEETSVKKGDKVKSGQEIGLVGEVPCEKSEESHIHLEILKDEKMIDPILILDKETQ